MAQEYSAFVSGSYTRNGRTERFGGTRVYADTDSSSYIKVTRTFAAIDTLLVLDDVAAIGHVYICNHDDTVALLLGADGTNYPVRIAPGDQAIVGWNGTAVHAKAESGTCYAEVMAMEGVYVAPSSPVQLYAARSGLVTTSNLYTVNPVTAAVTSVGAIGYAVTGLAVDPTTGILYGSTSNNSASAPRALITIDMTTGAGALIGAFGIGSPHTAADMAFDSSGGLWGWDSLGSLWSINKSTGVATTVGSIGGDYGGGLDFLGGTLWHLGGAAETSETVNTVTGAATTVAALSDPSQLLKAGKFDGSGVFWGVQSAASHGSKLYTIDKATGIMTYIADFAVSDIDALAWA